MDLTSKLRKVFEVEKQLRGLQSRLTGAERFLADQDKELTSLQSQRAKAETDLKSLQAQAANFEGEVKRFDAKLATIKEQMDNAKTNKEYKAFLTEVNTFKIDRDKNESSALELMTKAEELKKQIAALDTKRDERQKLKGVAATDRDARHAEIATRVSELKTQRDTLATDIPQDAMRDLQRLLDTRGENAMGVVEVVDVKRGEFHCSVCMMSLPMDRALILVKGDRVTRCSSCQCILYMDEEGAKALQPGSKTKSAAKSKKKAAEAATNE